MKRRFIVCGLAAILLLGLVGGSCAAPPPKTITLVTMPPGLVVNVWAVGMSDICSKYTPMSIKIMTQSNEMVWVPLTLTGEVDIGVTLVRVMRDAYLGRFVFEDIAEQAGVEGFPVRTVIRGDALLSGWMVRGDDPAQTIADLKGYRIATYPEGTYGEKAGRGALATGGLTMEDVIGVIVTNPIEAMTALLDGRVDASDCGANAPLALELIAAGYRFIPYDTSPEALQKFRENTIKENLDI